MERKTDSGWKVNEKKVVWNLNKKSFWLLFLKKKSVSIAMQSEMQQMETEECLKIWKKAKLK